MFVVAITPSDHYMVIIFGYVVNACLLKGIIIMAQIISREIRLKKRPSGMPLETDFEIAEVEIPDPGEGEVLVKNIFMLL